MAKIKKFILFGALASQGALWLDASSIQIISSVRLSIPPAEGRFHEQFLVLPLSIMEGYQNEMIVWRGSFLQIYSPDGKAMKRLGRLGEGPGEFSIISNMSKDNAQYYFIDAPNRLNVFDEEFNFKKRLFLAGEKSSPIIFDMAIEDGVIASAQRWRVTPGISRRKDKVISIYDKEGRWQNAFFEIKRGWKYFPDDSILGGKIMIRNKAIYFAFKSINCIWKFDLQGNFMREKWFGKSWWRKVSYDEKEKLKSRKKGNFMKYYEQTLSSGDTIGKIYHHKNHLLLQILRDANGFAETFIFMLDSNLAHEEGPFYLEGYQLSGVGKEYLYFVKHLGEYSPVRDFEVEVLKCRVDR